MQYFFVSCWTHGSGRGGIDQFEFNSKTGEMKYIRTFDEAESFGTCYVNTRENVLYALNETGNLPPFRDGGGGRVFSYKLDPTDGSVTKLGETPTFCPNPAYLGVDPTGRFAVVANHSKGATATKLEKDAYGKFHLVLVQDDSTVDLFSIGEDGSLGELLDVVKHYGCGPGPRQGVPHPHCVVFAPSGKFFAVCDKGNDTINMYAIENGALTPTTPALKVKPGSMPRYACFHPTLPVFYHNAEGNTSVSAYTYDEAGKLSHMGDYSALPANFVRGEGKLEQQALCMHPNGRYLYDIVNGPNYVAVFEIDQKTGGLTLVQNLDVGYEWTRGAALSPDARFMAVTCYKGGKVVILSVGEDGRLAKTGFEYDRSDAAGPAFWAI